ncbi:MAG: hypothetical protein ABI702_13215 [Burkholderiales bacterium]
MDLRSDDRKREVLHGLVKRALLVGVALLLCAGIAGGLLRVGIVVPGADGAAWLGRATTHHAALMICAFFGTVIGIERAVAVKLRVALLAPLASGLSGACLLLGEPGAGAWLGVVAALAFVGVNLVVVRRQRAAHTLLLLAGALAWAVGSVLQVAGVGPAAPLPWWFAFLILTIAAERLEMTRLMRQGPEVAFLLCAVLATMLAGATWFALSPARGGLLFGLSLVFLAAWLIVFDVARRTVRAHGLSRYMAVALLGGYAWLAVAGVAWIAMAYGWPARDIALHALGLGFVVSMMMGHAPVILPAIARVKLAFGPAFYAPLLALHLSLLLRLGFGSDDFSLRAIGAVLNAASIALFAATLAGAAAIRRMRQGAMPARRTTR